MAETDLEAILAEYDNVDDDSGIELSSLLSPPSKVSEVAIQLPPPPGSVGSSTFRSTAVASSDIDQEISDLMGQDPRIQLLSATIGRRRDEAALAPVLSAAAPIPVMARPSPPPVAPESAMGTSHRTHDPALHSHDDLQAPAKGHRSMTDTELGLDAILAEYGGGKTSGHFSTGASLGVDDPILSELTSSARYMPGHRAALPNVVIDPSNHEIPPHDPTTAVEAATGSAPASLGGGAHNMRAHAAPHILTHSATMSAVAPATASSHPSRLLAAVSSATVFAGSQHATTPRNYNSAPSFSTIDQALTLARQSASALSAAAAAETELLWAGNTSTQTIDSPLTRFRRNKGSHHDAAALRGGQAPGVGDRRDTDKPGNPGSRGTSRGGRQPRRLRPALLASSSIGGSIGRASSAEDVRRGSASRRDSLDTSAIEDDESSVASGEEEFPAATGGVGRGTLQTRLRGGRELLQGQLHKPTLGLVADAIAMEPWKVTATGVLSVARLPRLSEQLSAFVRQTAASTSASTLSPGAPTAIAVHPRFIAIGTSAGIVFLFDPVYHEILAVLSRTAAVPGVPPPLPRQGASVPTSAAFSSAAVNAALQALHTAGGVSTGDGPVTSLDVSPGQDMVVAGFFSGRIALFDCQTSAKVSVLKAVELHRMPVSLVRFVSVTEPRVMSVDTAGAVYFTGFSKTFMRWGVEQRCILDGTSAGPVTAVSVLLPAVDAPSGGGGKDTSGASLSYLTSAFTSSAAGGSVGANGAAPSYGTLVALCTWDCTFIIATLPDVSVLHRWARPAGIGATSDYTDAAAAATATHSVPVVSWGRARVCGSAVLEALEERCSAVRLMRPPTDDGGAASLSVRSGDDQVSEGRGSIAATDDAAGRGASRAPPSSASAAATPPQRPLPVLFYRPDSTLPPGTGVVTGTPVPVLARAWGCRLQLLQVQPAGGFPAEHTNIATESVHRRFSPILGPTLGVPALAALQQANALAAAAIAGGGPPGSAAQVPSGGSRVFGSLTSTLLMNAGIDGASGANGGVGGGPGGVRGSGGPLDFVLADDLPSADPIAALAWVSDGSLVYMTQPLLCGAGAPPPASIVEGATSLVLLETDSLQETDVAVLSGVRLGYASVSPPLSLPGKLATGKGVFASYAPSIIAAGGSAFLLASDSCFRVNLRPWGERVDSLVAAGEWLPALALGQDQFDIITSAHLASVSAAEVRARWAAFKASSMVQRAALGGASLPLLGAPQSATASAGSNSFSGMAGTAQTVTSASVAAAASAAAAAQYDPARFERLRSGPGPAGVGTPVGTVLERILRDYLRVMAATASGGSVADGEGSSDRDASHWAIVAAVCIDYCTTIQRPELIFGAVYDTFTIASATPVLLLSLEPFIMAGRLHTLSPIVMKGFVEAHTEAGAMGRVERCLLRLDLGSLDINQAVRLCLGHRLFSAFIHIANQGLLDFKQPIDLLLTAVSTCEVTSTLLHEGEHDRVPMDGALAEDEHLLLQQSQVGKAFGYSRQRGASAADSVAAAIKPMGRALRLVLARKLLLYLAYCLTGRRFPRGSLINHSSSAPGAANDVSYFFAGTLAASTGSSSMLSPLLPGWLQTPVTNILALASDPLLSAAVVDLCIQGSPLHGLASSAATATGRNGALETPNRGTGFASAVRFAPAQLKTAAAAAVAQAVSVATGSAVQNRRGANKLPSAGGSLQRFSVQRISAPAVAAGSAAGSPSPFLIIVQLLTAPSLGVVAGRPPLSGKGRGGAVRTSPAVPASLLTPVDLRASTLSFLLDPTPTPFPFVETAFLAAGAMSVGATALQESSSLSPTSVLGGSSAALSKLGPLPYPRLAAVLKLDTAAVLSIFGRLFTGAADAVLAAVWLAEGQSGTIARHRCMPGEFPAIGSPAASIELRVQTTTVLQQQQPQAAPRSSSNSIGLSPGLSLQAVLQSLSELAVAMAAADAAATRQAMAAPGAGGPAVRRGGAPQQPLQQTFEVSAATTSPRVALLLLFVAFQVGRLGPGMPPMVYPSSEPGSAVASALRLSALYLSSPAPIGKRVAGAVSGGSSNSALSDSAWILHDSVVSVFVSFTRRRAADGGTSAAWDIHSDDELFGAHRDGGASASGAREPSSTATGSGADTTSTSAASGASVMSPREALLIRLLRVMPVASELRALLSIRTAAAGQYVALAFLKALEGDAVAVIGAYLQAAPRADDDMEAMTDLLPGNGGIVGNNKTFAAGVFTFIRAWWALLKTEHVAGSAGSSALGGAVPGVAHASLSSAKSTLAASVDFEYTLASLCRASLLAALPASILPGVVSAALQLNPACVSFEHPVEGTFASGTSNASSQWHAAGDDGERQMQPSSTDECIDGLNRGAAGAPQIVSWLDTCPLASSSWLLTLPAKAAEAELSVLQRHLLRVLPHLVAIDEAASAALVLDLLGAEQAAEIITALDPFPRLQFSYLTSFLRRVGVIGSAAVKAVTFQAVQQPQKNSVSPAVHLRYIKLLCKFKPSGVLSYLMGSASYPLDDTLTVVMAAGVSEGVAYLKEHTGDIRGSLEVFLGVLDTRIALLLSALQAAAASDASHSLSTGSAASQKGPHLVDNTDAANLSLLKSAVPVATAAGSFTRDLAVATALCTRTSAKFGGDSKSQALWFHVLDWILAQQVEARRLEAVCASGSVIPGWSPVSVAPTTSGAGASVSSVRRQPVSLVSYHGSPAASPATDERALAALLAIMSEALRFVMEEMSRSVPLNIVLQKVLSDHSQTSFGEFRSLILTMLGSHAHDSRILRTAGDMMKSDVYNSVRRLHTGVATAINASSGPAPVMIKGGAADQSARCASCLAPLQAAGGGQGGAMGSCGSISMQRATSSMRFSAAPFPGDGRASSAMASAAVIGGPTDGQLAVFGCGHAYHQSCLMGGSGGGVRARSTCPQCAKGSVSRDRSANAQVSGGIAGGMQSPKGRIQGAAAAGASPLDPRWRPMQQAAGEEEDDDDDATGEQLKALGRRDFDGVRRLGRGATDGVGAAATRTAEVPAQVPDAAAAGSVEDESLDPYVARLRKARAARGGGRPLAELFAELSSPSGALQVRQSGGLRVKPARIAARIAVKLVMAPGSWAASGQHKDVFHGELADEDVPGV